MHANDQRAMDMWRNLSHREREVLSCLMKGMRNEEIAAQWKTVHSNISNVIDRACAKLNVFNRVELGIVIAEHPLLRKKLSE